MSFEREILKRDFLRTAGLADARRDAMQGDASTRAYERLFRADGASLILMDQSPSVETQPCPPGATDREREALGYNACARLAAGRVDAFVACAGYLRACGLSAPGVIASDPRAGFAVLEDLGDDLYARLIERGADETPLYEAATDVLVAMHEQTPPDILTAEGASWPLLTYDVLALRTATDIFVEWLPKYSRALDFSSGAIADWQDLWAPIHRWAAEEARVFCHRDYHAENLIWLPDRAGTLRVGLLDFQDAVRAHPAWDLSMLLHDARRAVSPEREAAVLARYLMRRPDIDEGQFMADFHALGAANIVRIIGIFARLVARDGKPRYRAFMPRLWRYLDRCLIDPAPPGLRDWMSRHVPPEARA